MKLDLSLALVLATLITGVIWGGYALVAGRRREPLERGGERETPKLVEYSRSFFPVLLLVLAIRSFAFEPYRIPSSSMVPTLLVGDFIFVSKFAYGLRLPVLHTLVLDTGHPERGDIAVFRLPSDPDINYIKRVVGLPGDEIVYRNHRLFINGEAIPLEPGERYDEDGEAGQLFTESLGDKEHLILLQRSPFGGVFRFTVPEGCYFMMGDNRDNSRDSRFPQVGCVPEGNLVGRASRIWLNWSWGQWPRWSRIGDRIR